MGMVTSSVCRSTMLVRLGWVMLATCTLMLMGCASRAYNASGQEIARSYWPQKLTLESEGTKVVIEPAPSTVDAATTVALRIAEKSPEILGKVVDVLATKAERDTKGGN